MNHTKKQAWKATVATLIRGMARDRHMAFCYASFAVRKWAQEINGDYYQAKEKRGK